MEPSNRRFVEIGALSAWLLILRNLDWENVVKATCSRLVLLACWIAEPRGKGPRNTQRS